MKRIAALILVSLCLLPVLSALAAIAPPSIPEGTLTPLELQLPKGKKLPVYTGPGENYAPAGKGRATVSTNDWVQIFGREGDWLLIQYGISEGRMRFGYIAAQGLLEEGGVTADLSSQWQNISQTLIKPASLTDDPLGSQGEMALLPQGSQVRLLGRMGLWAYVEARAGESLLRGFLAEAARAASGQEENRPFDLRAVSWGPLVPDYAVTRYFTGKTICRPQGSGNPIPTVWLRLDSRESPEDLEALSNFKVVSGRASCGAELVPLSVLDSVTNEWMELHFRPQGGFNRGALEIVLEAGESVGNLTIACTRTLGDGREEILSLPLAGVPEDSGYPPKGAVFAAFRYTPFAPSPKQLAAFYSNTGRYHTLGDVLMFADQPMPQAPAQVLALPWDAPDYRLFLVEGRIAKRHGPFGVYDVLFSLEDPPEGVWLAPYQECGLCDEIDASDMIADGVLLPKGLSDTDTEEMERNEETLESDFAILMLVRLQGRDGDQLDLLMKGLHIAASFSAEKWNISYEQHLTTTAIGPRSRELVDMKGVSLGEGVLSTVE